jgi:hypothetical protein
MQTNHNLLIMTISEGFPERSSICHLFVSTVRRARLLQIKSEASTSPSRSPHS